MQDFVLAVAACVTGRSLHGPETWMLWSTYSATYHTCLTYLVGCFFDDVCLLMGPLFASGSAKWSHVVSEAVFQGASLIFDDPAIVLVDRTYMLQKQSYRYPTKSSESG